MKDLPPWALRFAVAIILILLLIIIFQGLATRYRFPTRVVLRQNSQPSLQQLLAGNTENRI